MVLGKTVNSLQKRRERKQREKDVRRQEILNAAVEAFGRHGFTKTSMELVADEAALAVGTLYRYYKSKDSLFVAIVFDAIDVIHQRLEAIVGSSLTPVLKLERVWEMFFAFHEEHPMYYRALLFLHDPSFSGAFSESEHAAVSRFSGKNFRLLARMAREGMERGDFRQGHSREVADFLWCSFVGLVHLTETRRNFDIQPDELRGLHRSMLGWIKQGILV